ncbi:MAG: hypothetical protein PHU85_14885 [Phycisphaerae bacterium]|nr:hypothetical protein [Phycisphaerae bacterium]
MGTKTLLLVSAIVITATAAGWFIVRRPKPELGGSQVRAVTTQADMAGPGQGSLPQRKRKSMGKNVTDMAKAIQVCEDLRRVPTSAPELPKGEFHSRLYELAGPFQDVEAEDVAKFMARNGLPELLRVFDGHVDHPTIEKSDLMFVLKVFAMYGYKLGLARLPALARRPDFAKEYLWSVIFNIQAKHEAGAAEVIESLRDPLPEGFACVAYLDLCNTVARSKSLKPHPFDTPAGRRKLEAWLSSRDTGEFSYAHSSAAALPFLAPAGRDALFSLAMDHVDPSVQMEAAWASASLGNEKSLKRLQEFCVDPNRSLEAQEYLEELGRKDLIPKETRAPDFKAKAEMCQWLEYPMEFGRPPTKIEVYDNRELYWPPTDDRRRVWLLKYVYDYPNQKDSGIGMVGSVTFCLFSEATVDLSPEDVYGLHCAWELENNGDSRAPAKRSVAAGRAILAKYNKGF